MRGGLICVLLCALIMGLAACDTGIRNDAAEGLEQGRRLSAAERARLAAQMRGEVLREDRPFYGAAVEVERGQVSGEPLPKAVEGARGISLALRGQADVETIAAAITAATEIPVNIRTRYILGSGEVVSVPIGTTMAASYEGPLSAFLDRLGARMDIAWSYDGPGGGVITIDRMTRKTWRLALPTGTTEMTDATDSGVTVSTTRTLDPWAELEQHLTPLAPSPARLTLSPQSGRVEVFGPPSVLKAVGEVLDDVAATAAMRIGLEVAVYFVDTDRADTFGIGVDFSTGIGAGIATLTAAAGGDAPRGLVIRRGVNEINFRALARDRSVVDYRLASTVAQSGAVSPIALTEERSYLRSTTTETDKDTGDVTKSHEIDVLETGLSLTVLPRLAGPRRIQLALTLSQRAFRGFDPEVKADTGGIQAPTVDSRAIRNQTVLAPGETLVLSGYEQDVSEAGDSGLGIFRTIGLGGSSEANRRKIRMVILVRPTLIPSGGRG